MRPVKQACSNTIGETISSVEEAVTQRKRARFHNGSPCPIIRTSLHLHITTFNSHDSSSHRTMHHERGTVHWSVLHSLRFKTDDSRESGQPFSHVGYAGIRVGEAENPGPATHDRDWTVTEQPNATHRWINEAGDSVRSSQDSVNEGTGGRLCAELY